MLTDKKVGPRAAAGLTIKALSITFIFLTKLKHDTNLVSQVVTLSSHVTAGHRN